MAWFLKRYKCDRCGNRWEDEWSCACNDRCPQCNAETDCGDDYDDLTVVVEPFKDGPHAGKFVVLVSPPEAEESPEYDEGTIFSTEAEARAFAAAELERVGL